MHVYLELRLHNVGLFILVNFCFAIWKAASPLFENPIGSRGDLCKLACEGFTAPKLKFLFSHLVWNWIDLNFRHNYRKRGQFPRYIFVLKTLTSINKWSHRATKIYTFTCSLELLLLCLFMFNLSYTYHNVLYLSRSINTHLSHLDLDL